MVPNRHHKTCIACGGGKLDRLPRFSRIELVSCANCGLVFASAVPTQQELIDHYQGYSRDTSFVSPVSVARREEWLERFESYRSLNRIIDIGAGVGDLLDQAQRRGWETYGTEFTSRSVEVCQEKGHVMHKGAIMDAPFPLESVDVVVYAEVIEHINNHNEEIGRVASLIRPGGLLFITTPNFESLSRRVLGDRWNVIQYPEHLAYFTPRSLDALLTRFGFRREWCATTGLSVTRLRAGLRRDDATESTAKRRKSDCGDERIRTALDRPLLRVVKKVVNRLLTVTSLGDSIKAGYVRCR